ncbi:hypothetical protein ADUPG1_012616, partial [Aduncisulcus paluster]
MLIVFKSQDFPGMDDSWFIRWAEDLYNLEKTHKHTFHASHFSFLEPSFPLLLKVTSSQKPVLSEDKKEIDELKQIFHSQALSKEETSFLAKQLFHFRKSKSIEKKMESESDDALTYFSKTHISKEKATSPITSASFEKEYDTIPLDLQTVKEMKKERKKSISHSHIKSWNLVTAVTSAHRDVISAIATQRNSSSPFLASPHHGSSMSIIASGSVNGCVRIWSLAPTAQGGLDEQAFHKFRHIDSLYRPNTAQPSLKYFYDSSRHSFHDKSSHAQSQRGSVESIPSSPSPLLHPQTEYQKDLRTFTFNRTHVVPTISPAVTSLSFSSSNTLGIGYGDGYIGFCSGIGEASHGVGGGIPPMSPSHISSDSLDDIRKLSRGGRGVSRPSETGDILENRGLGDDMGSNGSHSMILFNAGCGSSCNSSIWNVTPSGEEILCCGFDNGSIQLFSLSPSGILSKRHISNAHTKSVNCISTPHPHPSPVFLSGGADGTVKLWDCRSGTVCVSVMKGSDSIDKCVLFRESGVCASSKNKLFFIDIRGTTP